MKLPRTETGAASDVEQIPLSAVPPPSQTGVWVNDVHSQLNPTHVGSILKPRNEGELAAIVQAAGRSDLSICTSGGRHSMGAQQFATDGLLIDTRALNRVVSFDKERGLIEVEAGIQWPELIRFCLDAQAGTERAWTIAQKQTGADLFTLAGSASSNIHGRGLASKPLIGDIESLTLLTATAEAIQCSRTQNPELFRLAVGGYGLFGIITRVMLRLVRRRKLERLVELVRSDDLIARFDERIHEGCLYGDFQFSIDERSPDFLQVGVLACYLPIDDRRAITASRQLSGDNWLHLLHLAYTDRREAFRRYAEYYLSTTGQTYWSDLHQLGPYLADYVDRIAQVRGEVNRSSLMITELYVPRAQLGDFLRTAAGLLHTSSSPVIYGTVRLIECDNETYLPWARQSYACIIFNLLTLHSKEGLTAAAETFRRLIDLASDLGGSYYLTYHKFARRDQVERAYPKFGGFLALKRSYDPLERFQSDWYRHYRELFSGEMVDT